MILLSISTKPRGILYIVFFYFAVATVLVIVASLWPSVSTQINDFLPVGKSTFTKYAKYLLYLLVIAAIIVAIDAIGLYLLKPWARFIAILIGLALAVILLGLAVLWYLILKEEGKQAFGLAALKQEKPATESKANPEQNSP